MNTSQQKSRALESDHSIEREPLAIAEYFPVGRVKSIQAVGSGNSSSARKLTCSTGSYILRKLRDTTQAQVESAIASELVNLSLSPPFVPTRSGQWYIPWNGHCYNLQNDWSDRSEPCLSFTGWKELGQKLATFHSISRDATWPIQIDRFDILQQWNLLHETSAGIKLQNSVNSSYYELLEQLEEQLPLCSHSQQQCDGYIHGDLGMWNVLITSRSPYIIDYGEVRKGHSHLDLAALAASGIDHSNPAYAKQQWTSFCIGYETVQHIHSQQLHDQLQLWMVRGAVSLLLHHGINERTIVYAQQMLERIPRISAIIRSIHH